MMIGGEGGRKWVVLVFGMFVVSQPLSPDLIIVNSFEI